MRALTRVLNAVQRLIEHAEGEEPGADETGEEAQPHAESPIQLLDVTTGSAAYPVAAMDAPAALKILADTGRGLEDPAGGEWDPVTLSSIEDLSQAARSIGCDIEIRSGDKDGAVIAKITPQSYEQVAAVAFVTGPSSVYGYLERVGGAVRPHCGLRIAAQPKKMIICHVATEELVRQLGQHVYKHVRVSGMFTWFQRTWRIKSIEVQSFEPAKTGSIREALDAIWEAGGKAWDEIEDPEAVIKEMR